MNRIQLLVYYYNNSLLNDFNFGHTGPLHNSLLGRVPGFYGDDDHDEHHQVDTALNMCMRSY